MGGEGSGRESMLLSSHPQFKFPQLSRSEGVGLGDDRDDIHKMVKLLHEFNVQRLQTAGREKDNMHRMCLNGSIQSYAEVS